MKFNTFKNANDMTRKEFEKLPYNEDWTNSKVGEFTSLIILPTSSMHDSGYRCMAYVPCKNGKPLGFKLGGASDVIHIDGIGGYGDWFDRFGTSPDKIKPRSWSIDCLKKSGLLQLFCNYSTNGEYEGHELKAGSSLSSFELDTVNAD